MTISYACPQCEEPVYNISVECDEVQTGDNIDFGCEFCGCEFEVTFNAPTVNVIRDGHKKGLE